MFCNKIHMSRSTAGTTEKMPGDNELFFNTYQANKQLNQISGQEPELLPVSCGYFFAIVRQLLLKQRKMVIKYVLLDTKGVLFDRLIKYIKYHSLSDLLVELMQLNLRFDAFNKPAGSSLAGDDEDRPNMDDDEDAATQAS